MEISPDALVFKAPLAEQSTRPLYLHNKSSEKQAYKIKTTAPKLYCVRPNASVLGPGETIEVAIIRQTKEQPKPNEKSKDKFLILAAPVSDEVDADTDFPALWTHLEDTSKEIIVNKKIKVYYEFPTGDKSAPADASSAVPASKADGLGAGVAGIAGAGAGAAAGAGAGAGAEPNGARSIGDVGNGSAGVPASEDIPVGAASAAGLAAATAAMSPTKEDYNTPLKSIVEPVATGAAAHTTTANSRHVDSEVQEASQKAQDEISSKSKDLKQSKSSSSEPGFASASATSPVAQQSSGVPPHFVLVFALLAFLIGWQFF